jgi:ATP-binding cassette subfamily B protein
MVVVPKFGKIQKQIDGLNLVARESLTGVRVIRAYNTEKEQEEKFEKNNEGITKSYIFVGNAFSLMNPFMNLIFNGLSLLIFWVGSYLVNTNGIAYTQLFQFAQYGTHILMSFMFLSMIVIMLPRGIVSLKRISEVINTKTKIVEGTFDAETEVKGKVEFRNVSFRYPDAEMNVLENINFTVEKGQTIAFIGSTGSGKSTLVNLIPRFFDTTFGEVSGESSTSIKTESENVNKTEKVVENNDNNETNEAIDNTENEQEDARDPGLSAYMLDYPFINKDGGTKDRLLELVFNPALQYSAQQVESLVNDDCISKRDFRLKLMRTIQEKINSDETLFKVFDAVKGLF